MRRKRERGKQREERERLDGQGFGLWEFPAELRFRFVNETKEKGSSSIYKKLQGTLGLFPKRALQKLIPS